MSSDRAAILDRPRRRPKSGPDRATGYAQAVRAGRLVAGPYVRAACRRHLDDLARWGTAPDGVSPCYFDVEAAARVIAFFEAELVLVDVLDADGEPSPFTLQPWQAFVVGSLFGWKSTDGARRFRTCYLEAGKGAGKSPLAAGIGLWMLACDAEPFPEVYSAAVSQKQAGIIWQDAVRMRDHAPRLKDYVDRTAHELTTPAGGTFSAISSEHRALEGKRPSCALIDEIHEHRDANVLTKMRRGTKGRRQALIVEVTNSGYDKTTIGYQHHDYSTRVVEGLVDDPTWFAYVCALDESDVWTDRACWPKANPNIGVSIPYRYLEDAVREAQGMPAAEGDVQRLNFCIWTDRQTAYLPSVQWVACRQARTDDALRPYPCVAGLDLGESDDMSALALVWRLAEDAYHARVYFWTCEAALRRYRERPYDLWRRQGLLTITEGDVTDYVQIRSEVSAIARRLGVQKIAFDRRGALQLSQELMGDGLAMIDQPQGFFLSEPLKTLARLVAAGPDHFTHDPNAVLDWQAGNLSVLRGTKNDIRPIKTFGPDKIDGMVALVMALAHATTPPPPPKPTGSVYNTREVFVLGMDDD